MDLPIVLDKNATFVTGVDELRQDVYLLIKESIMTWYQGCSVGSQVVLHSSDVTEIKLQVQDTLKQLKSIEVLLVEVIDNNTIFVRINYNGREIEEIFEFVQ